MFTEFTLLVESDAISLPLATTLGFLSTGWLIGIVGLVIGIAAVVVFLKFRNAGTEKASTITSAIESPVSESRFSPPPRVSTPQSLNNANHSKELTESLAVSHLPIGQLTGVYDPAPIEPLEVSEDEGLLAAIDEVQDDSEADTEFRAIALRVLGGFKTSNAVEALSQLALYDLSANLRAKAVGILADFDHQSVFESVVLSCADPSREVRAAGARALVRLTFDRGDEWARLALSKELYVGRQVARAAVEAGLAERSFDRLTLRDEKSVYEAFALVYLMVRTGETEKIFEAIRDHRDVKIRIALLHIVKVANVAEVIPHLSAFIAGEPISSVVGDKAREVLLGINAMPVNA